MEKNQPVSVSEADTLLHALASGFRRESLLLGEAAGRILAAPIIADAAYPSFDRVCMDGFALNHGAVDGGQRRFPVESFVPAGLAPEALRNPEACIEVMTGAVLPTGCDTVVPVEHVMREGEWVVLRDGVMAPEGRHVHATGRDYRAGDVLVPAGTVLTGPRLAAAAAVGCSHVTVARRPRLHLVLTGDELVPVTATPRAAQIRMTHPYAFDGLLRPWATLTWSQAADQTAGLHTEITRGLTGADALLLTGGVSAGRLDLVPKVLADAGVHVLFHKITQKPGRPLWVGRTGDGRAVFAFPGNPVSALVCMRRYFLPWLWRGLGLTMPAPVRLPLSAPVHGQKDKTVFMPVRRRGSPGGGWVLEPVELTGSGDFAGLTDSDGFIELPPDRAASSPDARPLHKTGDPVAYYEWNQP